MIHRQIPDADKHEEHWDVDGLRDSCDLSRNQLLSSLPDCLKCMQVTLFEGSYTEYAADLRRRRGGNADPTRVKYRKMA